MPLLTELENVRSPLAIDMALLTELCAGATSTYGLEGPVRPQVGKLALEAPNSYSLPGSWQLRTRKTCYHVFQSAPWTLACSPPASTSARRTQRRYRNTFSTERNEPG